MKTHYVVLLFLSFILFTNVSCDEDDILQPNDDESLFTSTNYIYEGDLRTYYLETKNTQLTTEIAAWEQLLIDDPNNLSIQGEIADINAEIASNNGELESIVSPASAFLIVNPIFPPIPPPPLPCLCLDVFNSITHLVLQQNTNQINLTITATEDQNTLVNTTTNTQVNSIPNTNNLGKYQSFSLLEDGFTGEAMITVTTEDNSYSILANFQNLE